MPTSEFAGARKMSVSLLSPLERRLSKAVVPRIPGWLETYHLTLMNVPWCLLILLFSRLAARNIEWLWGVSAMIALQYVTDFFDGKVGKYRNTGLVKWGFYMDHLLDYLFFCSIVIGYAMILPDQSRYHLLFVMAISSGFVLNSFLTLMATGEFRITHLRLGPTEFRIAIIVINTLLIFYGTRRMIKVLPYVFVASLIALSVAIYRTQRIIWRLDMGERAKQ
jgi:phosphatidylglycerophosphate synthase